MLLMGIISVLFAKFICLNIAVTAEAIATTEKFLLTRDAAIFNLTIRFTA